MRHPIQVWRHRSRRVRTVVWSFSSSGHEVSQVFTDHTCNTLTATLTFDT